RGAAGGWPAQVVASELQYAGVNPAKFYDPQNPDSFSSNVAAQLQDPKVRQDLLLAPQKLALEQQEFAQKKAEFGSAKVMPEAPGGGAISQPIIDSTGKIIGYSTRPLITPQGQTGGSIPGLDPTFPPQALLASVADATNRGLQTIQLPKAGGGTIQVSLADAQAAAKQAATPSQPAQNVPLAYNDQQKTDIQVAGKEAEDVNSKSNAAQQLQQLIEQQRNRAAQGIFSGQQMGQDWFLKFANTMRQFMTQDQYDTLSRSQAWGKEQNQIIALAVKQFAGSRIAAREIPFFGGAKADATQTDQGMDMSMQDMWRVADQQKQLKEQMDN